MKRIPFPPDVNPSPDANYKRNTHITPDVDDIPPPPILPFLFVCALAVLLSLLSGCTSADANEPPSAGQLYAAQEQRLAIAAAKVCGPGKTAVWTDSAEMRCHRNQ